MHDDPGVVGDRPLAGKTILLAEDEERLRQIVAMMIEELGAETIAVADGEAAIAAYESRGAGIDLVMLDLRMRGVSGAEALARLSRIDPAIKVVIISGYLPDDQVLRDLKAIGGGFVEKPFNLERLGEVLESVLRGEPVVPDI
jgi:DNA-binding NtrC family response regulator